MAGQRAGIRLQVRIERIGEEAFAAWDAYVDASPDGTIFHRAGWGQALARAFGHPTHYLAARIDGRIVGLLPLVHKRSIIFGDALISVGFGTGGGPLAGDYATSLALQREALRLGAALGVAHVELRDVPSGPTDPAWNMVADRHAGFHRPIPESDAAILSAIPRKGRRYDVRKSLAAGLRFEPNGDLFRLHRILAESYRNLGTPSFGLHWFAALQEAFRGQCTICLVLRGEEPLAAALTFRYANAIMPFYAGGTWAARAVGANDFLYYNLMRLGREQGCAVFDFGRSKPGTGSYAYKRSWGFVPRPIQTLYAMPKGGPVPQIDPSNPRYRALIAAWKRMPLALTTRLGPWLSRQIG